MSYLIRNAFIVNEGSKTKGCLLIEDGIIKAILPADFVIPDENTKVIHADGKYVLPGIIDDHVHFREPGLTHKGDMESESKAAVAGGITSIMEMPNTVPQTTSKKAIEDKIRIAYDHCLCNFSFYLAATNDNISEILNADIKKICGVKIFMGSSTGNMLVDNKMTLVSLFAESPLLIAVHAEDEQLIKSNLLMLKESYGENIDCKYHPIIRSAEACYRSSSFAIELAEKFNTRLHVMHLSSTKEIGLFSNTVDIHKKRITSEACIIHLVCDDSMYGRMGNLMKVNPAVKSLSDRDGLLKGLNDGYIDVISTDHAPHTLEEKSKAYLQAPSGAPMVQHSLPAMMDFVLQGKMSVENLVYKMCHNPAIIYGIEKRGFIREGYYADLVVVDTVSPSKVQKENILYKCKWSPLEGHVFNCSITHTMINGKLVFDHGLINTCEKGKLLTFNR